MPDQGLGGRYGAGHLNVKRDPPSQIFGDGTRSGDEDALMAWIETTAALSPGARRMMKVAAIIKGH